jgi:hypothetical protein
MQAACEHPFSPRRPHNPSPPPTHTAASKHCYCYSLLTQAQALHPLSDVSVVRRAAKELGDELARRMQAAAAAPGSRQVGASAPSAKDEGHLCLRAPENPCAHIMMRAHTRDMHTCVHAVARCTSTRLSVLPCTATHMHHLEVVRGAHSQHTNFGRQYRSTTVSCCRLCLCRHYCC